MDVISPAQQVMLGKWGQAVSAAAVGCIIVISTVTGNSYAPLLERLA